MQINLNNFFNLQLKLNQVLLINADEELTALTQLIIDECHFQLVKYNNRQVFQVDRYFDTKLIEGILCETSLFDDKNLLQLQLKNKLTAEQQKDLLKLISNLDANNFLLIISDKLDKKDLSSELIKNIDKIGTILTIESQIPQLKLACKYILKKQQLDITPDALQFLLELNSANITQLLQETNKLSLLFAAGTLINYEDIQCNAFENTKYNVFALSSAYLQGNLTLALKIFENIFYIVEDAILINWSLTEDIRKILKFKSLMRDGITIEQACKQLKIWGESIKNFNLALKRISYSNALECLNLAATIDLIIKGVLNQSLRIHLIKLITKLSAGK